LALPPPEANVFISGNLGAFRWAITASTPGEASAAAVSSRVILPRAMVLNRIAA
jgi:hypothetical protein